MAGMTRVVIIQDANITQKYQELLRKLEAIGGQKIGRHVVHCRLFNRKTITDGYSNQRMFMLRMSQNDDLVYAVLVNERTKSSLMSDNGIEGNSEECSLLECGLDGANILQQVEIYAFKSDGQFEGTQYAVGDFVVSVCTFMSRNNQPRGLVIEVQYAPCYTVSSVETLFDEFLANLVSEDRLRKPIENMHALFDKVGLPPADYSLKHTALQYVAAFNILRKFENPLISPFIIPFTHNPALQMQPSHSAFYPSLHKVTQVHFHYFSIPKRLAESTNYRFGQVARVITPSCCLENPDRKTTTKTAEQSSHELAFPLVVDLPVAEHRRQEARAGRDKARGGARAAAAAAETTRDMEEEMAAAVVLFGGDDPRFDVVDLDASVLPTSFSTPPYEHQQSLQHQHHSLQHQSRGRLSFGMGDHQHHQHDHEQQFLDDDMKASYQSESAHYEELEPEQQHHHDHQRSFQASDLTTAAFKHSSEGDAAEEEQRQQEHFDGMLLNEEATNASPSSSPPPSPSRDDVGTASSNSNSSSSSSSSKRKSKCQHPGCDKISQGGGLCVAHGGGYKCQTPFCAFFNLRTCQEHGGSRRCSTAGCTKVALGVGGLCCSHGGGRKCSVDKCEKHDAGMGFCLAHGGGRSCSVEGCTKKQIRYGVCSGHGGRARCKEEGCDKYDRGQGKCKSHGGGYFCKVDGCTKKDKGGGLCAAHGGGKKCYVDGCTTPCVGGGRCKLHGGGKRCETPNCANWAINGGKCKDHGGTGKRCSRRGCDKHDQGGGHCLAHGGGYKCTVPDCTKKQIRFGRCCAHGGKPRCAMEGCERLSQHRGLCKAHGGSKPCDVPGCERKANSGGKCISHGGGGRCRTEGCTKTNRGGGHCKAHGGGKKCSAPECNEWAIGGGACPQHDIFGSSSVVCV